MASLREPNTYFGTDLASDWGVKQCEDRAHRKGVVIDEYNVSDTQLARDIFRKGKAMITDQEKVSRLEAELDKRALQRASDVKEKLACVTCLTSLVVGISVSGLLYLAKWHRVLSDCEATVLILLAGLAALLVTLDLFLVVRILPWSRAAGTAKCAFGLLWRTVVGVGVGVGIGVAVNVLHAKGYL